MQINFHNSIRFLKKFSRISNINKLFKLNFVSSIKSYRFENSRSLSYQPKIARNLSLAYQINSTKLLISLLIFPPQRRLSSPGKGSILNIAKATKCEEDNLSRKWVSQIVLESVSRRVSTCPMPIVPTPSFTLGASRQICGGKIRGKFNFVHTARRPKRKKKCAWKRKRRGGEGEKKISIAMR